MVCLGCLVHVQGMYSEGEGYDVRGKGYNVRGEVRGERREGMRSRAMSWLTGSSLQWL